MQGEALQILQLVAWQMGAGCRWPYVRNPSLTPS